MTAVHDSLHIVCPQCDAVNRIQFSRMDDRPRCGKCKQPLFTGAPVTLNEGNFERQITRNDIPVDEKTLQELVHEQDSPAVRNAALGLMLSGDDTELPSELMAELEREGQTILVAAIDLLVEPDRDLLQARLEALLARAGETTRLSVVAFMLRRLGPEFEPFARQVFETLLKPGAPSRARAARRRGFAPQRRERIAGSSASAIMRWVRGFG